MHHVAFESNENCHPLKLFFEFLSRVFIPVLSIADKIDVLRKLSNMQMKSVEMENWICLAEKEM